MMAHSDKIENYLNTTWDAYVIAYTKIGLPWRTVDHDQESITNVTHNVIQRNQRNVIQRNQRNS